MTTVWSRQDAFWQSQLFIGIPLLSKELHGEAKTTQALIRDPIVVFEKSHNEKPAGIDNVRVRDCDQQNFDCDKKETDITKDCNLKKFYLITTKSYSIMCCFV